MITGAEETFYLFTRITSSPRARLETARPIAWSWAKWTIKSSAADRRRQSGVQTVTIGPWGGCS
jgi:hypothetical protein